MAKKAKEIKEVKVVTVKDLAEEFDLTPSIIRRILRAAGLRASQISDNEGKFGPRAKYGWQEGSEELKQVLKILADYVEAFGEEGGAEEDKDADDGRGDD